MPRAFHQVSGGAGGREPSPLVPASSCPRGQKLPGQGPHGSARLVGAGGSSAAVPASQLCCAGFSGWLAPCRGGPCWGPLGRRMGTVVVNSKGGSPGRDAAEGAGLGVESQSGGAGLGGVTERWCFGSSASTKPFTCVPRGDQNCVFKYHNHGHSCCAVHTPKYTFLNEVMYAVSFKVS